MVALGLAGCATQPAAKGPEKEEAPCLSREILTGLASPVERMKEIPDVNADGRNEIAVPDGCGSGGCDYRLFISMEGECFKTGGAIFGKSIATEAHTTLGHRDLIVTGGSAIEPTVARYAFNGSAYVRVGFWPWRQGRP